MPPYQRPVSPLTLETCLPPVSEIDENDLLGSDDELDDTARAAQWQKIDRLAESYLQGNPLFILSASLRGPFENGWNNPWKKSRREGTRVDKPAVRPKFTGVHRSTEPVIQETDPQNPRYREDISPASHDTTAKSRSGSVVDIPAAKLARDAITTSHFAPRSGQKRPAQRIAPDEQSRMHPRTARKPKEDSSLRIGEPTIVRPASESWLKKGRKRMNFTEFEPPSSPTPKGPNRQSGIRPLALSRDMKRRMSKSPSVQTPGMSRHMETLHAESISPQSVRLPPPTSGKQQASPSQHDHAGSSFRVLASTSQLPRFEYRFQRQDGPSSRSQLHSPGQEHSDAPIPASISDNQKSDLSDGISENRNENTTGETGSRMLNGVCINDESAKNGEESIEAEEDPMEVENDSIESGSGHMGAGVKNLEKENQQKQLSKSLRFADDGNASDSRSTNPQPPTENTYDDLPSAQAVSAPPGLSDRIPSLHSTAVPKVDTEDNDTQLSTQAALLHAQKSFQDELDSPENELGMTPGHYRAMAGAGNDSLLAHETPLFRPDTSERALPRSLKHSNTDRVQYISTQRMIDAASPYVFSTEKKSTAFRSISPQKTSPQRVETVLDTEAPSHAPQASSPAPGNRYDTAQSGIDDPSPCPDAQQAGHARTNPSTTQATTLPFTVSGSTPPTAQDGQGGIMETESFNLSQAIADAGSWLQQSFV